MWAVALSWAFAVPPWVDGGEVARRPLLTAGNAPKGPTMSDAADKALESARATRRRMYMQPARLRPSPRGPGMEYNGPSTREDKLEQLRTELSIVTDRRRSSTQNAAHPPERDAKVASSIKAELLILAAEKDDHPDSAGDAQKMLAELNSEFGDPAPEPGAGLALTETTGPGWQDDLEVLMPDRPSEAANSSPRRCRPAG